MGFWISGEYQSHRRDSFVSGTKSRGPGSKGWSLKLFSTEGFPLKGEGLSRGWQGQLGLVRCQSPAARWRCGCR